MQEKEQKYIRYDDYVQSANALFHFMKEADFLKAALKRRALVPRYCTENVSYLNLQTKECTFREIAVLQKCFCDIPLHKIGASFELKGTGAKFEQLEPETQLRLEANNTHFDFYGEYAIGFSKRWGEQNNLQPIHYLNENAACATDFSSVFQSIWNLDTLPDEYVYDTLNRLCFIKPLRGTMPRTVALQGLKQTTQVDFYKNFHDEHEWRYVPDSKTIAELQLENVIANPNSIPLSQQINECLEHESFGTVWLHYDYDDIRYIIVPNNLARIDLIQEIMALPEEYFSPQGDALIQKQILISKMLVFDEVRKDW